MSFLLYYLLHLFSSQIALQLLQVYSHATPVYEYMNSLKMIHEENNLQRKLTTGRARRVYFLSIRRYKFWNFSCSTPTKVATLWVRSMYQSAQKNSGYITVKLLLALSFHCVSLCLAGHFVHPQILSVAPSKVPSKTFQ